MSCLIYTASAVAGLIRFAKFLSTKDKLIAKRAIAIIRSEIEKAAILPDRYLPVPDLMRFREIFIDFSNNGYVVRFRYEPSGDIFIVPIEYRLEDAGE